jgi:hypothetical protein
VSHTHLDTWVEQHLETDRQQIAVAGHVRHHGGQIPARAVATDRETTPIDLEHLRLLACPTYGGDTVVDRAPVLFLSMF